MQIPFIFDSQVSSGFSSKISHNITTIYDQIIRDALTCKKKYLKIFKINYILLHFLSCWKKKEWLLIFNDTNFGLHYNSRRLFVRILYHYRHASIHWRTNLQKIIIISMKKAKYWVVFERGYDFMYWWRLLKDLQMSTNMPTTILSNDISYIKLKNNPIMHKKQSTMNSNTIVYLKRLKMD